MLRNLNVLIYMSPQASVRLTLATLLYSGKSPDGHHILVNFPALLWKQEDHNHKCDLCHIHCFMPACLIPE